LSRTAGGTPAGLAFGVTGFAFIIFAALLGARKRVPVWRVGRAQTWMRGHLWLGLLTLPLIWFHSGFHYGHGLTAVLMTLLIVVTASGVIGAVLQHFMPRVITRSLPMETIYEEIDHVRAQLREEAEEIIARATGGVAAGGGSAQPSSETVAAAAVAEAPSQPLRDFFEGQLQPFLANPAARSQMLAYPDQARAAFAHLRTLISPSLHSALEDLENICDEQRQLSRQARLHLWLHGWLLVHVPISVALVVLGVVHAVVALRF
jgi:hypothetical protein